MDEHKHHDQPLACAGRLKGWTRSKDGDKATALHYLQEQQLACNSRVGADTSNTYLISLIQVQGHEEATLLYQQWLS